MKLYTFSFLILFLVSQERVSAQQCRVSGNVVDDKGKPLTYATIALLDPADSTMAFFGISDETGHFDISNVAPGAYVFQVAYLGYFTFFKKINLPEEKEIGAIGLKTKGMTLGEVVISTDRIPILLKKDTLEYDAAAFKTKPDAVTEDLLKKMPGIEVDKAGNIKAQGEEVKHVLVDGKVFFGDDPKTATRNLPADAIQKVQVLDKKSEESDFSGIKDGQHDKTINLVLKEDKKNAWFGDAQLGGGSGEHYQASSKLYRFTGTSQFACLGMVNNINQFGFSFQDYINFNGGLRNLADGNGSMQVRNGDNSSFPINFGEPEPGLITSGAGGLNYTYEKKKGNRFNISYLGDGVNKDLSQYTYTQNFSEGASFFKHDTLGEQSQNRVNRLNAEFRHNPDSTQNILINASAALNQSVLNSRLAFYSLLGNQLVNTLSSQTNDLGNNFSGNVSTTYLKRRTGRWKLIKLSGSAENKQSLSKTEWNNITTFLQNPLPIAVSQFQKTDAGLFKYSGGLAGTCSLSSDFYLEPQVNAGGTRETLSRRQGLLPGESNLIDSLTARFSCSYSWLRPALNLKRNTEKTRFHFGPAIETGILTNALADGPARNKQYLRFTPSLSFENDYSSGSRYNVSYESFVNAPAAQQMMPVVNNINPLQLFTGNSSLRPEYVQSLNLHWLSFDQFSFTSFFANLAGEYTRDKINWSRTIDPVNLRQNLTLYNAPEDYRLEGNIEYSRPVRKLGLKVKLNLSETWNRGMNLVNGTGNTTSSLSHAFTLSVENRKKKKWDLSAGGGLELSEAHYSIMQSLNSNYSNYSFFADMRFLPDDKWYISASADLTTYTNQSFNQSVSIPMLKLGLTHYVLKGGRGVVSLEVFDLLNKNTGLQRISELNYLQQQQSNIIGRYLMLSFKYRLSKFVSKDSGTKIEINGKRE